MRRQATFEQFDDGADFPGVGRDEWGPTARHPIPENEASWSADDRALQARGFDPAGLREWDSHHGPEHHGDDRERPGRREAEADRHADAVGQPVAADGGQVLEEPEEEAAEEPDYTEAWGFDPEAETVTEAAVGKFVHSSWGYNQTNVEMAQIVDVSSSGKTVVCRMARPEVADRGHGSESMTPTAELYGDEFRMHVRGYDEEPHLRGSYPYVDGDMETGTRCASLYPIEPGETVHQTPHGYRH